MKKYTDAVIELLNQIKKENKDAVEKATTIIFDSVASGGLVYVFGAGHSSILVEEAFHRAGGLIPVYPILHDFISPHITSKIAGKMERLEGVAKILFDRAKPKQGDCMLIASNSGINATAIEMALECKKNNIPAIAFTSLGHSQKTVSRHSTKKKLFECVDLVLDNHCPQGDALVEISGVRVAAGSSIANNFMYHWVLTEVCEKLAKSGKTLPIYLSANLPGGDEHNEKLEATYRSRIPLL